jgi:protein-L-isoaspartate O-methyltransferase
LPRTINAADFHLQLVKRAEQRLKEQGYEPVQHVAIEKAGRPDVAGRSKEGSFDIIVECFVKEPTEKQLIEMRKKYKGRKLVIVIPYGMRLQPTFRKHFDELWEFRLMREGRVVVPVGVLEIPPEALDRIETNTGRGGALDAMMPSSHDMITRYFDQTARKKKQNE